MKADLISPSLDQMRAKMGLPRLVRTPQKETVNHKPLTEQAQDLLDQGFELVLKDPFEKISITKMYDIYQRFDRSNFKVAVVSGGRVIGLQG